MRVNISNYHYNAEIFLYKPWISKSFFNFNSSYMSQLVLSASFKNLCYVSTAIINCLILLVRGSTFDVRI